MTSKIPVQNWEPEVKISHVTCTWCPAFSIVGSFTSASRGCLLIWSPALNPGLQSQRGLTLGSLSPALTIPIFPPVLADRHCSSGKASPQPLTSPCHTSSSCSGVWPFPLSYFYSPSRLGYFFLSQHFAVQRHISPLNSCYTLFLSC